MEYFISSRDYLSRARDCLAKGDSKSLFHAAFELRCGIEARMSEYLEAWDHISDKRKKGWRIANLARDIEKEFKTGEKYIRFAVHDRDTANLIICYYYTPVSSSLKKKGEKLGNYLHALKKIEKSNSSFWTGFTIELKEIVKLLQLANIGTLLGPPLTNPETQQVIMNTEKITGIGLTNMMNQMLGKKHTIQVEYLDKLPNIFESEAYIWKF